VGCTLSFLFSQKRWRLAGNASASLSIAAVPDAIAPFSGSAFPRVSRLGFSKNTHFGIANGAAQIAQLAGAQKTGVDLQTGVW
jgi:hypothetical protein